MEGKQKCSPTGFRSCDIWISYENNMPESATAGFKAKSLVTTLANFF